MVRESCKAWRDLHTDLEVADYPHIPATLLSKSWLDSASDPTSSFPAEFPPSLFYGPDRKPLVITQKDGGFEGMGGLLPSKNLKVTDVAEQAGPSMTVDVIGESNLFCRS
jgi:F-box/leucine-rich repeat protein 10/11